MSAGILDIEFPRNGDWSRFCQVVDEDDVAIDLTGGVFDMDIRYTAGSVGIPLIDVSILCPTPATGEFEVTLLGSSFDNIGNRASNTRLLYDIVITQSGRRIPLISGQILLTPGISDNA